MKRYQDAILGAFFLVTIAALVTASIVPLGRNPAPIGIQDDLDDNTVSYVQAQQQWNTAINQTWNPRQSWTAYPPHWKKPGVMFLGSAWMPAP